MRHKWGCQVPNAPGSWNPEDVAEIYGDGFYVLMQDGMDKLARLRQIAPQSLILTRYYLSNWHATDPVHWAQQCAEIYRQNKQYTRLVTWANEQNLAAESGGAIGASDGRAITQADYRVILDWNLRWLDEWHRQPGTEDAELVFPGLAYGHSDDQDDGAGDIGLRILEPVIQLCTYGNIHLYVQQGANVMDEWNGLGRLPKQRQWFQGKPLLIGETGHFMAWTPESPQKYQEIGYRLQSEPDVQGFAFFIHADPTRSHQQNDMSRNQQNYVAIRDAIKVERTPYVEPTPEEPSVPEGNPGLYVGYQVWQWSGVRTVATYEHLDTALKQIGASILSDKYMDSDAFMGRFDNDPLAVKDIQVLKDRRQWCEDHGYDYFPWDVPRGIPTAGRTFAQAAIHEAEVHAGACNFAGLKKRLSDLEFYASFFGYSLDGTSYARSHQERMDAAWSYYQRFKQLSGTETILQPDIRQIIPSVSRGGIDVNSLVNDDLIAELLPQTYAYWFKALGDSRPYLSIVQEEIVEASKYPVPWGMCLYSEDGTPRDTPPKEAAQLASAALEAGAKYLMVFKAPIADGLHQTIKNFAKGGRVVAEPTQQPDARIGAWQGRIWTLSNELEAIAGEARNAGYGWVGNGLDGASLSAKAASKLFNAGKDN